MQKIIEFAGGINRYRELSGKKSLHIPDGADMCPFCEPSHPMRRHGTYSRTAVTAGEVFCVAVLRLLCAATGHTVSLLPDFLLPRKQHVVVVVAAFFTGWALKGLSLTASVHQATSSYPSRQKGAYWVRCFDRNLPKTRSYMASVRPRQTPPAPSPGRLRDRVARVLDVLREGFHSLSSAFEFHSRNMHALIGVALL